MKLSRRGILKALPALPIAIKSGAAEAEKMVGADLVGVPAQGLASRLFGDTPMSANYQDTTIRNLRKRIGAFIGGFPEFKLRRFRRRAREERRLDPDIAALKSVSMGTRLRLQERANLRRLQLEEIDRLEASLEEQLWSKAVGFEDNDW